jgi:hypothetical protein
VKPAWECTRREYYNQIANTVVVDSTDKKFSFPMVRLNGIRKTMFLPRVAWDKAGIDREIGQFWIIARQIQRTENMKYLRPDILVEYLPMWKKFFDEHPELQTSVVVSNRKLW